MTNSLETARHPETLRRVCIEPLTRVEGHGKVTLLLDEDNHIQQARLHIVEFRGFERFIQGRPYWELPVLVQRLCGICPVSHHLAAAKACDQLVGVDQLTPTAEKVRRLMHLGQTFQSHACTSSTCPRRTCCSASTTRWPTATSSASSRITRRSPCRASAAQVRPGGDPGHRRQAGPRHRRHPGGVNKNLSPEERDYLAADSDQMVEWAEQSVQLIKRIFLTNTTTTTGFGRGRQHPGADQARTGPSSSITGAAGQGRGRQFPARPSRLSGLRAGDPGGDQSPGAT
jgi:NAD-reducing hydrogenase large subunit